MYDDAHEETEKILKELEERLSKEYAKAEKEVAEKLDDYMRRFEIKDKKWQKWVAEGKKTEAQYKAWREQQILMGERWENLRRQLAEDFAHVDMIAKSIIEGTMPEVYCINFNYATYEIEHKTGIDTSFTLYDHHAVEKLMKTEETIIPPPGKKLSEAIRKGKAVRWNEQQIQSVMMQSILQGESIGNIATRLAKEVGESNRKVAIRDARTITTGVENAGHLDGYQRAQKMGIECQKQWLATVDGRTRHWHRQLDGQAVDLDKPFKSEFGDIRFPGDPTAHPSNIYNCRCRLLSVIKGFEIDVTDKDIRDMKLEEMTYDEWKAEKKSHSNRITMQDEIAESMKNSYIWKYRR